MRGDVLDKSNVLLSIFMKFGSRNHLNKLDLLTPQDIYSIVTFAYNIVMMKKCRARLQNSILTLLNLGTLELEPILVGVGGVFV